MLEHDEHHGPGDVVHSPVQKDIVQGLTPVEAFQRAGELLGAARTQRYRETTKDALHALYDGARVEEEIVTYGNALLDTFGAMPRLSQSHYKPRIR